MNTFNKLYVKKVFKMIDSSQKEYYNTFKQMRKEMKNVNHLKIRLSAVRVNAGKTQQEMADEMGVSRVTIGNWETGKVKMKEPEIRMYAEICNFPREYIFLPY